MKFRYRWLVVALLAATMATWRGGAAEPPKAEGVAAQALRVPAGCKAAPGTAAEPYTKTGWATEVVHEKTGIEMVFIPAGEFLMGSPRTEKDRHVNEGPIHKVRLTQPFYMGKYEVTQGQWSAVMGNNPSHFKGSDRLPVEQVSWNDCRDFVSKLSGMGLATFLLPTEAQWEYACRAGTQGRYSFGDKDSDLLEYGWHEQNSDMRTHEVGTKRPNAWGLYDMHGNLWEWCQSRWQEPYSAQMEVDPVGEVRGICRVQRGGSWYNGPSACRSAIRVNNAPDTRSFFRGFRVVCIARS
jgi:formylglycine-generating enzyme required for sulfatase activity